MGTSRQSPGIPECSQSATDRSELTGGGPACGADFRQGLEPLQFCFCPIQQSGLGEDLHRFGGKIKTSLGAWPRQIGDALLMRVDGELNLPELLEWCSQTCRSAYARMRQA
jgi:hypothetical protein